jgi:macrodomain Ter protein organizer (MatP/YcbG family)
VLKYILGKLEEQKETYWKQRSHVNWLREGDRNTSFFHACATQRKKNRIKRLQAEDGQWIEERDLCGYIGNQ